MNEEIIEVDVCDECGNEFNSNKLKKCYGCDMILCPNCLKIHAEEHYAENERDEKEW